MNSAWFSIENRVCGALSRLELRKVSTHAHDGGVILLSGSVASGDDRMIAFAAALTTPSVLRLTNEIQVSSRRVPPPGMNQSPHAGLGDSASQKAAQN